VNLLRLGRNNLSRLLLRIFFASHLIVMIRLALHDNVLAEVLIAVHSGGEELDVGNAGDPLPVQASINARLSLYESNGSW